MSETKRKRTKLTPTKSVEKRVNRILTNIAALQKQASKLSAAQRKAVGGAIDQSVKGLQASLANPAQSVDAGFTLGE